MFWLILLLYATRGYAVDLVTYISSGGLHGEIRFVPVFQDKMKIQFALKTSLQYPNQLWHWELTKFPVDYTMVDNRCNKKYLGESVVNLTHLVGPFKMPGNEANAIEVDGLLLYGEKGLWGKAVVLTDVYRSITICASVTVLDRNVEKLAEAHFIGPIVGIVHIRWLGIYGDEAIRDTIISADLHHADKVHLNSEHSWKIYVTDVFDIAKDKTNCNALQTVFDPNNEGIGKSIGDLDSRLGKLRIAASSPKKPNIPISTKTLYRDPRLLLLYADLLVAHRTLYFVIFHPNDNDFIMACAKIIPHRSIITKAFLNSNGINGEITLTRSTPFDPTWVNVSLSSVPSRKKPGSHEMRIQSYRIHELPAEPGTVLQYSDNACASTKYLYNPLTIDYENSPSTGFRTQDQYAIGDLSAKMQGLDLHDDILPGTTKLSGIYWDTFLPLSGTHSVVHRSIVLHKYSEINRSNIVPWTCGTIILQQPENAGQMPILTAEVTFRYPLVGKIIFRQPTNEPEMDTTIIIEYLVHADGSTLNQSLEHRWMIHENPPGQDYYNWTGRCLSAGNVYNPYKLSWDSNHPEVCSNDDRLRCRLGDLGRHRRLNIAGQKAEGLKLTRMLFTDSFLPLTGASNILGKSLLIYDDHGPKDRGERLACSRINRVHSRKAIAKDWFGNGQQTSISGKVEFFQQNEYDITNVEITLDGLGGAMSGYHIHMTPVEIDLEFPCEETSLYGYWNPLKANVSILSHPASNTNDHYEIGNLSGKFGNLNGREKISQFYNDTLLPLFGPMSILGRSVIVHKKERNLRWACSTIERGYTPSEARELRAIASFHHPYGYAYGYIRMTQVIYRDGSMSDTIIEINLRHPGIHDRNVTRNHNWSIYVNPVGFDSTVKEKNSRCVAAGYRWNPYYNQLADPANEDLYKQECGSDFPLRCDVGDISGRLGPIDIGLERRVLIDPNLPLEGVVSAMGKPIIIFEKNFGTNRYACANIEPDYDIVKYVNIRKPPRFVASQFLEDIRFVMGIPEWMLTIDKRKTNVLHNEGCIQFLMHFKGPVANKLEQDFSRLIAVGKQESPSIHVPGYVAAKRKSSLGYRQCGSKDPNEKNFSSIALPGYSIAFSMISAFLWYHILLSAM